jgi:hypothetical protein
MCNAMQMPAPALVTVTVIAIILNFAQRGR